MRIRLALIVTAAAAAASTLTAVPASQAAPVVATHAPLYLVSLGDSYAVGYEPGAMDGSNGFVAQLPALAAAKGYNLQIVQFGCGGATTTSLLTTNGCPNNFPSPGQQSYPDQTQIAAATQFIEAHQDQVGVITVSIGGNDITSCAAQAAPVPCVASAAKTVSDNVTSIAQQLRAAAGPATPIIGTTYPDVILGAWVNPGGEAAQSLARLSVMAFRSIINPALTTAYTASGGQLVDVTASTGAYGDMSRLVKASGYGMLPSPVARVCKLTYFCQQMDIHPTTRGYTIIARLVAAALPAA